MLNVNNVGILTFTSNKNLHEQLTIFISTLTWNQASLHQQNDWKIRKDTKYLIIKQSSDK